MFQHVYSGSSRRRARFALALSCLFALTGFAAAGDADAAAPVISGTPPATVVVGTQYSFTPAASDADGNRLRFSIVGKPQWMWFSTSTGQLRGNAKTAQGNRTFPGITILVSDGTTTVALPAFSIAVLTSSTNSVPVISGTPVTAAEVARPYAFRPAVTDADGDPLTFTISGKPTWATFDATNGTLYGTPTDTCVGTYANVSIKVSDGKSLASLAPFSITVAAAPNPTATLHWTPPTYNTDGSAITGLAGYRVFYGTAPGQYSTSMELVGSATNSVVLQGLSTGTWYFSVKAYNTAGIESTYSQEVVAVL